MRLVWTDAGYASLVNAENTGTREVLCAQIAIGRGARAARRGDTALQDEIKRVDTISGQAVDDNIIHVVLRDETGDRYAMTEFGLIADDGTLLARYAQNEPIIEKAAASTVLLPIDATLTDVDATQVVFPSIEFVNPPWGEDTQGVVQKATAAIAQAGTDNARGMTAKLVFAAIKSFFGDATGAGAGKGLDADKVDGEHGAYYRDLGNATGNLPPARTRGTYPISITGRAAVADEADEASHADMASNAGKLGGKMPSDYRDASRLTNVAPVSVIPLATDQTPGGVASRHHFSSNAGGNSGWFRLCHLFGANSNGDKYRIVLTGNPSYNNFNGAHNIAKAEILIEYIYEGGIDGAVFLTHPAGATPAISDCLWWEEVDGSIAIWLNAGGSYGRYAVMIEGMSGYKFGNDGRIQPPGTHLPLYTIATTDRLSDGGISAATAREIARQAIDTQREKDWRVGSTYTNVADPTNPGNFLPGTWEKITEGFLYPVGAPNGGSAGSVNGENYHTLTPSEVPNMTVRIPKNNTAGSGDAGVLRSDTNGSTQSYLQLGTGGGGKPHNNMPRHLMVYMWKRTA